MDDLQFPQVTYRRGASGVPVPVLRGTGIRVQAVAVVHQAWGMAAPEIADEYGVSRRMVEEVLALFEAHRAEIEAHRQMAERLAAEADG